VTYEEWEAGVHATITGDPLWTVKAYRLALFASDLCWRDLERIRKERLYSLVDQLYRAVAGVGAQIAEGYSRKSGKDRARFYEYALGSARESRDWYFKVRHVLAEEVVDHRLTLLTRIAQLLMKMVPDQRTATVAEPEASYSRAGRDDFLAADVPLAQDNLPADQRATDDA